DRTETFLGAEDVPGELGGAGRDGGVDRAEDAVDVVVDKRGAGEVPHQTRDGLCATTDAGDEPVDAVEETHGSGLGAFVVVGRELGADATVELPHLRRGTGP